MLGELSAIKYIYISWTDLKVKKIAGPQNTAINIIYLTEVSQVEWHEAFDFPTSISAFNLGCVNILMQGEIIVESYLTYKHFQSSRQQWQFC